MANGEGDLKRSIRIFMGTAMLAGMLFTGAPAASAGTVTAAQDCTTTYLGYVLRPPNLPTIISYTPPADLTIEGNQLLGAVSGLTTATTAYVDCVI